MPNSVMKLFLQVLVKVVNYLGHCSLVAVWFLSSTSQIQDEKFLKMLIKVQSPRTEVLVQMTPVYPIHPSIL